MREEEKKLIEAKTKGPIRFYGVCEVVFSKSLTKKIEKTINKVETLYVNRDDAVEDINERLKWDKDYREVEEPNTIAHYFILEYQGDLTLPGYTELAKIARIQIEGKKND